MTQLVSSSQNISIYLSTNSHGDLHFNQLYYIVHLHLNYFNKGILLGMMIILFIPKLNPLSFVAYSKIQKFGDIFSFKQKKKSVQTFE